MALAMVMALHIKTLRAHLDIVPVTEGVLEGVTALRGMTIIGIMPPGVLREIGVSRPDQRPLSLDIRTHLRALKRYIEISFLSLKWTVTVPKIGVLIVQKSDIPRDNVLRTK